MLLKWHLLEKKLSIMLIQFKLKGLKMKKSLIVLGSLLLLIGGCTQPPKKASVTPKVTEKIKDSKAEVIVAPIDEKKAVVVTKVKPEIDVVHEIKKPKDAVPVVVVDPVEADAPVKAVEVLPADENTVPVVEKVEPTIEAVGVVPLEDDSSK